MALRLEFDHHSPRLDSSPSRSSNSKGLGSKYNLRQSLPKSPILYQDEEEEHNAFSWSTTPSLEASLAAVSPAPTGLLPPLPTSPERIERSNSRLSTRASNWFQNSLLRSPLSLSSPSSSSESGSPYLNAERELEPEPVFGPSSCPITPWPSSSSYGGSPVIPARGTSSNNSAMSSSLVHDISNDEADCPVCLESLSLRLRGEKPHIVPICGHKLHEACFEAVYGPVSRAKMRSASVGVCGVCRRDMKLGDPLDSGKNKFAAISGIPGTKFTPPLDTHKMRSVTKRTLPSEATGGAALHDPTEDDELLRNEPYSSHHISKNSADTLMALTGRQTSSQGKNKGFSGSHSQHSDHSNHLLPSPPQPLVQPRITVRAEHPTVARSLEPNKKTNITCMVTVEVPSKAEKRSAYSQPRPSNATVDTLARARSGRSMASSMISAGMEQHAPPPPPSEVSIGYSTMTTQRLPPPPPPPNPALEKAHQELQARLTDVENTVDEFGRLICFDFLHVRKDQHVREFSVYLFEEALLCVIDEKRKPDSKSDKLRLKGRVFIAHIVSLEDTSSEEELSLSITMGEGLDAFVVVFKDHSTLRNWHRQITDLVQRHRGPDSAALSKKQSSNSIRDSVRSEETHVTQSGQSLSQTASSAGSTYTRYSRTTMSTGPPTGKEMATVHEDMPLPPITPLHTSRSFERPPEEMPTVSFPNLHLPHDFPGVDLMLVLSVPATTNAPSAYSLKLRLIKSSLSFLIASVGPRARISLVTYCSADGPRAMLKKTPFLAVGREDGRQRLQAAIDDLGSDAITDAVDQRDEKITVLSAVNLALDILMQRKAKSPLSGMIVMNDGKDQAQKQNMSLVMARAEAAGIPFHTIGYGANNDPSSLWILANHTSGTYTFVKELYHLKETMAAIVGGILSIAATSVRLHVQICETRFFKIKKVTGASGAILSADGCDVDVDLGELRYGEKREFLLEVEMTGPSPARRNNSHPFGDFAGQPGASSLSGGTATDQFFIEKAGLNPLSLQDDQENFYEDEYDGMSDEVPLFEVNASYKDPVAAKVVSRLPYPALLMIILTPPISRVNPPALASRSDPGVVRRRIELLCSDMVTRCLLLMSRHNPQQAATIMIETKKILCKLLDDNLPAANSPTSRSEYKSVESAYLGHMLTACLSDVENLLEGIQGPREIFESNQRMFAAQSAIILRDQKAWTARSQVERAFFRSDYALWLAQASAAFM